MLKGSHASDETRKKMSIADKGRIGHSQSPETRARLSETKMGNKNALGCHRSLETRAKISIAMMGNTHRPWNGGLLVTSRRHHAKRRGFGHVYLNLPFPGCEGHHVDNKRIINMPKALHRSVYHRQTDGRGMVEINAIAYAFLFSHDFSGEPLFSKSEPA